MLWVHTFNTPFHSRHKHGREKKSSWARNKWSTIWQAEETRSLASVWLGGIKVHPWLVGGCVWTRLPTGQQKRGQEESVNDHCLRPWPIESWDVLRLEAHSLSLTVRPNSHLNDTPETPLTWLQDGSLSHLKKTRLYSQDPETIQTTRKD